MSKKRGKPMKIKDETLGAMEAMALKEYRVQVAMIGYQTYKIYAHDPEEAVEKVRNGGGTLAAVTQPEVVGVRVGRPGMNMTQTQAEQIAKTIENAQSEKSKTESSIIEVVKG